MSSAGEILQELFDDRGIDYATEHKNVRQGWYGLECPWCGPSDFYLGINADTLQVSCWRCGPKRLGDTLAELLRVPVGEALRLIQELRLRPAGLPELRPSGTYRPPSGIVDLKRLHRRYLMSRGFDPEQLAKLWGVRGLAVAGLWSWSLFVPAQLRGRDASWLVRYVADGAPVRYRAAAPDRERYPLKSFLYGSDFAGHSVVVHEGPLDVWATGPGAVATCGLGYTPEQILALSRYSCRTICFDNEPDASRRARELADALSVFPGETSIAYLDSEDPASASRKELRMLRRMLR